MEILSICIGVGGLLLAVSGLISLIGKIREALGRGRSAPPRPAPAPRPAPRPAPVRTVPPASPRPVPAMSPAEEETGEVIYFANAPAGKAASDREFRFNYRKVGGQWRAYILRMPPLGGRDSSAHITHRLKDRDCYYVCWDTPLRSLKEVQTVSKKWADLLLRYILTGQRFG